MSPRPSANDRPYWLAWSQIPHMGPSRLKTLFIRFGSLEAAWLASEQDLLSAEGIGFKLAAQIVSARRGMVPQECAAAMEQACLLPQGLPPQLFTPADAGYPAMLWEIPDPPPLLYVRGTRHTWSPAIAIVGTRRATDYGQRWTRRLAQGLVEAGYTIVSGMAAGIDGFAHRAALEAGGETIAVLGTGVDVVYPPRHDRLAAKIQAQGCLVSDFPCGTPPAKTHFPRRNRIVAALCQATMVIEAPSRSGALITTQLANDYNRDVFALPGSLDAPSSRGCLEAIDKGAGMILGVEQVLEALGDRARTVGARDRGLDTTGSLGTNSSDEPTQTVLSLTPEQTTPPQLQGVELEIWTVLTEPLPFDRIASATQLETSTLSSTLLMMELAGVIEQLPGMRYRRG